MATDTANYNLRKPATTDLVSVTADIGANMDIIDAQMKTNADDIASNADDITTNATSVTDRNTAEDAGWTSFTPVIKAAGTPITLGNGSLEAAFKRINKSTIAFRILLTMGTTTNLGSGQVQVNLPVIQPSGIGTAQQLCLMHTAGPNGQYFGVFTIPGTDTIIFYAPTSTSSQSVANLALTSTGTMGISGVYECDPNAADPT